jgi:hypothetical protein
MEEERQLCRSFVVGFSRYHLEQWPVIACILGAHTSKSITPSNQQNNNQIKLFTLWVTLDF